MHNMTQGWAQNIPVSDYSNIVAKPVSISSPKITSMRDSADSRLRVKVRMTFAGLPTRNHAIYLPDEMYAGMSTFVSPFNKPVQKHHDDYVDPVGRIIDVRYVDTTNQAAQIDSRIVSAMQKFRDKKSSKVDKYRSVKIFQDIADSNPDFTGVGYIEGLWDIPDKDTIEKIIDGRLFTVSTSFVPKGAYCSECINEGELTDWRHSRCEHERGDIIDGRRVVAIPFGFDYSEASFVNDPAAVHAHVLEFGQNTSFEDASKNVSIFTPKDILSDAVLVSNGKGFKFSDSTEVDIPMRFTDGINAISDRNHEKTADSNDAAVIGSNEQCGDERPQGIKMKLRLADLIKDTKTNYEEIAKFLDKDAAKLTGDLLSALADSVFIGPGRTFPVKDLAHALAIKKLLEEVEDSVSKTDLSEILDGVITKFESANQEKEEDSASEESAAEEDSATEDSTEEVEDSAGEVVTLPKAEHDALVSKAEAAAELEQSRAMFKKEVDRLKVEVTALESENANLLKEYKENLSIQLADAQISAGLKVTDKNERIKNFLGRSIQSLRDSLSDLTGSVGTGMAKEPSGKTVDNPLKTTDGVNTEESEGRETDSSEETQENDSSSYQHILNKYFELCYGPGGQRVADSFLNEQKRSGYLPAHINP